MYDISETENKFLCLMSYDGFKFNFINCNTNIQYSIFLRLVAFQNLADVKQSFNL